MKRIVMTVVAVVAGVVLGGLVNMGLVMVGGVLIPPPGGVAETMEGFRQNLSSYQPIDFLFPFLAHAMGTLAGAFVAAKIAGRHTILLGLIIGVFFLLGGILMVVMVGGPVWFIASDLILAYLPMGYLGARLAGTRKPSGIS